MSRYTRKVVLLLLAAAFLLSGMSLAVDGVVNASALYVRSETSTDSESLGKEVNIICKLLEGVKAIVIAGITKAAKIESNTSVFILDTTDKRLVVN